MGLEKCPYDCYNVIHRRMIYNCVKYTSQDYKMVRTDYLGASHHEFSCIVDMQGVHIMSIGVMVGKKIRLYRKKAGLTQSQFANECFMSESYVSRFERGLVDNPTQATLEHIASSIGTTVLELIRESEVPGMIIKDRTRRDFSRYMEVFERFPAWRQEQIRKIMDVLFSEAAEKQLSHSDCTRLLVRK